MDGLRRRLPRIYERIITVYRTEASKQEQKKRKNLDKQLNAIKAETEEKRGMLESMENGLYRDEDDYDSEEASSYDSEEDHDERHNRLAKKRAKSNNVSLPAKATDAEESLAAKKKEEKEKSDKLVEAKKEYETKTAARDKLNSSVATMEEKERSESVLFYRMHPHLKIEEPLPGDVDEEGNALAEDPDNPGIEENVDGENQEEALDENGEPISDAVGVNRIEIGLDSDADGDANFDKNLKKKKKGCTIF